VTDRINCDEHTELVVARQGAVRVEGATVIHRSERMAVVEIGCATKYARMLVSQGDHGTTLHLEASSQALHLHPVETGSTEVRLPEFDGWTVEVHEYDMRYSARVLFVKEKA